MILRASKKKLTFPDLPSNVVLLLQELLFFSMIPNSLFSISLFTTTCRAGDIYYSLSLKSRVLSTSTITTCSLPRPCYSNVMNFCCTLSSSSRWCAHRSHICLDVGVVRRRDCYVFFSILLLINANNWCQLKNPQNGSSSCCRYGRILGNKNQINKLYYKT